MQHLIVAIGLVILSVIPMSKAIALIIYERYGLFFPIDAVLYFVLGAIPLTISFFAFNEFKIERKKNKDNKSLGPPSIERNILKRVYGDIEDYSYNSQMNDPKIDQKLNAINAFGCILIFLVICGGFAACILSIVISAGTGGI